MMRNFHYYIPVFLQKVGYVVFFILYKIFTRIEIRGKENLQGISGPVIIASNHTSELDVTAVPLALPFFSKLLPIYFVSNSREKYKTFGWRSYIYGGIFFNMLGGYSVYSGHKNYGISLEDHIKLLLNGRTVFIFPEGKRTLDGNLNPAHGGLGYMAYITQATVVPIAIDTFYNISWFDFFTFQRKITLTVLEPMNHKEVMETSSPNVNDFRSAGQKVLDRIKIVL